MLCFLLALVGISKATITTKSLDANDLTFTCTILEPSGEADYKVIMLHGFPNSRLWYDPLLQAWEEDDLPVKAVACDLRGYSTDASPDSIGEYSYNTIASDVTALADAAEFDKFHLIGHDHGALLGWIVAAMSDRVLSYTAMSVPHVNTLSEALCGDNTDEEQVVASNYFNQFMLNNSATINDQALTNMFNALAGASFTAAQFQTKLWWYWGVYQDGYSAVPRVVADDEVSDGFILVKAVRNAIPLEANNECVKQKNPIGIIDVPVLFVCGAGDSTLLCTKPWVTPSTELVPDYEAYTAETCGHDFFKDTDCTNSTDGQKVMDKMTDFLLTQPLPSSNEGNKVSKNALIMVVCCVLIWVV